MILFFCLTQFIFSTVYFEEHFNVGWEKNWSRPLNIKRGVLLGRFRATSGKFYANEDKQRGLETLDARRNYLFYSNFSKPLDSRDKDLVLQYTVRLDINTDCAGAYVKLLGHPNEQISFSNESVYSIMFGPDICGAKKRETVIALTYKNITYFSNKSFVAHKDHLTHAYTLIIRKDDTIIVKIDGKTMMEGKLHEFFDIPLTKIIPDVKDIKPMDWDDREYIIDVNDKKPDDWDDREFIEDPYSFRPPYIKDDEEWIHPKIMNPDYKGEWRPRWIKNPNFKGFWFPNMVSSEPVKDPSFGHFYNLNFLGIDLFQYTPGSIMGNFLVTDDIKYAENQLEDIYLSVRTKEVHKFDDMSKEVQKKIEEERLMNEKDYEFHQKIDKIELEADLDSNDPYQKTIAEKRLKEKILVSDDSNKEL